MLVQTNLGDDHSLALPVQNTMLRLERWVLCRLDCHSQRRYALPISHNDDAKLQRKMESCTSHCMPQHHVFNQGLGGGTSNWPADAKLSRNRLTTDTGMTYLPAHTCSPAVPSYARRGKDSSERSSKDKSAHTQRCWHQIIRRRPPRTRTSAHRRPGRRSCLRDVEPKHAPIAHRLVCESVECGPGFMAASICIVSSGESPRPSMV